MSHWDSIRARALELRNRVCSEAGLSADELTEPRTLVDLAVGHFGLFVSPEHPASANLRGAEAAFEDDVIYIKNTLEGWPRVFTVAHEIGHKALHDARQACDEASIDTLGSAEDADYSAQRIVGYGPGERREREANVFALEFLLPPRALGDARRDGTADAFIDAAGIPFEVAAGQLLRAVLVPETVNEETAYTPLEPDVSQRAAARHLGSPLLVNAGPGTGKTQCLSERIEFLLGEGIEPERILALTFSNKAAEEMRERVAARRPVEAPRIDMMTFHAFGLNILRRYWERAGLEPHSPLVDKIEALMHLERNLAGFGFQRYLSLSEPTRYLPDILAAISRSKDELCGPEEFARLAQEQLRLAGEDEKALAKAERAVEASRVYEFYQAWLDEGKRLDFGDLILRSVRLLEEDADVRHEVRGRYRAILVDEFQDVNRASGVLLREIAGDTSTLWVVGDIRQSIYRWRGASPSNIERFNEDFPGADDLSLEVNYRSAAPIVKTFSEFAGPMIAGNGTFRDWTAKREDDGLVTYTIAPDARSEALAIAAGLRTAHDTGTDWRDAAVISRTHRQLTALAKELERDGVPVFYLGDVFERPEIRDLLSLIDLAARDHGHSLVRVARIPEYSIPEADVARILEAAKNRDGGFHGLRDDAAFDDELSERGRLGWRRLCDHLADLADAPNANDFILRYLFRVSRFLDPYLADESVPRMTARIAIYQFARFAESVSRRIEEKGRPALLRFQRYVRRVAWFREDKNLAQIPEAADGLDAVRLLTVHAAKGLEFKHVFIPNLATTRFPTSKGGAGIPVPDGLTPGRGDFHDEEEECLFFVALSRARDALHLSRAERYGSVTRTRSSFLNAIDAVLPPATAAPDAGEAAGPELRPQPPRDRFYVAELDRYLRCPQEYYYTGILRLKARDDESVYRGFHVMLRESIAEAAGTPAVDPADAFARRWEGSALASHAYADLYRAVAADILGRVRETFGNAVGIDFEAVLMNARVSVDADEVNDDGTRVVLRRIKTGKTPSENNRRENRDALLKFAAGASYAGRELTVLKTYLASGENVEIGMTDRFVGNAVRRYNDAIDGIRTGHFPAEGDDQNCPNCPHFFICTSGDDAVQSA